jgi:hypothetical protein
MYPAPTSRHPSRLMKKSALSTLQRRIFALRDVAASNVSLRALRQARAKKSTCGGALEEFFTSLLSGHSPVHGAERNHRLVLGAADAC